MNTERLLNLREVLSDHAEANRAIMRLMMACHIGNKPTADAAIKMLAHALRYVEEAAARDIDRIYNPGPYPEAIECDYCHQWLVGEYCDDDRCKAQYEEERREMDTFEWSEAETTGYPSRA